jgi:hypothetical protein
LEARPGELDAHHALAIRLRIADVNNPATGGEVGFTSTRRIARKWDAQLQIGAYREIKARDKGGAASA